MAKSRYQPGVTWMTRPLNSMPWSCSMAFRATSAVAISTNPMALEVRGVPSVTTSQVMTLPTPSNSRCNSAYVVREGRRWTCSIVAIAVFLQTGKNCGMGLSFARDVHPIPQRESFLSHRVRDSLIRHQRPITVGIVSLHRHRNLGSLFAKISLINFPVLVHDKRHDA